MSRPNCWKLTYKKAGSSDFLVNNLMHVVGGNLGGAITFLCHVSTDYTKWSQEFIRGNLYMLFDDAYLLSNLKSQKILKFNILFWFFFSSIQIRKSQNNLSVSEYIICFV